MEGSNTFAMVLVIFFLAFVCFFFAFHPNGVATTKNPGDVLQWLFGAYGSTIGATGGAASGSGSTANAPVNPSFEPTPTGSATGAQQFTEANITEA